MRIITSPEERHGTAVTYAHRIKNPVKREYALRYVRWRRGTEAEPVAECSYMAAQAVRMTIDSILDKGVVP